MPQKPPPPPAPPPPATQGPGAEAPFWLILAVLLVIAGIAVGIRYAEVLRAELKERVTCVCRSGTAVPMLLDGAETCGCLVDPEFKCEVCQ